MQFIYFENIQQNVEMKSVTNLEREYSQSNWVPEYLTKKKIMIHQIVMSCFQCISSQCEC